ncbi:MAG TPA: hypothetical protein VKV03_12230 [Candidatus Binataceae bacterium]|nr:hypothetical protein [Candidatus Binataceae bacterium]
MSAKSAVTVLRSPSSVEGSCDSDATRIAFSLDTVATEASAVPHSPQNLNGGGFSTPHLGHRMVNALPHSPQNFFPAGFSVPHFAQRIALPDDRFFFYHPPSDLSFHLSGRCASR